ncbi:MAG: T9SS type A sorting domain-containing protein [Phaeodactylibacter sp.]|nr:T9SS type A sorting domain-containing protein [Phaeodactylibacter sp.]
MKKLGLYLVLCLSLSSLTGLHAQVFPWAHHFAADDYVSITKMVVDSEGHLIVAGTHRDTMYVAGTSIPFTDYEDFFIAKFYPAGGLAWIIPFTGEEYDIVQDLKVDADDNIYLSGSFIADLNFKGQTLNAVGQADPLLMKLSPDGDVLWITTFGSKLNDISFGIDVDSEEMLAVGHFRDTMVVAGTTLIPNGIQDMWLASLDPATGGVNWIKSWGGAGYDRFNQVVKTSTGEIYACGHFSETLSTNVGNLFSDGGFDVIIAKLSGTGEFIWMVAGQSPGDYDAAYDLIVDENDNAYFTGSFEEQISFNNQTYTGQDDRDIFIISFDPNKNIRWAYNTATYGPCRSGQFTITEDDQTLYCSGSAGSIFEIGDSIYTNLDERAMFIGAFELDGTVKDVTIFDGPGADAGFALTDDGSDLFISGIFNESIQISPDYEWTTMGQWDAFIARWDRDASGIVLSDHATGFLTPGSAYYNPSREFLHLKGENISLWDTQGRLHYQQKPATEEGIPTTTLPNGIYHLRYQHAGEWYGQSVAIIR